MLCDAFFEAIIFNFKIPLGSSLQEYGNAKTGQTPVDYFGHAEFVFAEKISLLSTLTTNIGCIDNSMIICVSRFMGYGFLNPPTHLYKRLCLSVRPSIRQSCNLSDAYRALLMPCIRPCSTT